MKILVVTQYFWPEEFRINDICKGLLKEGHQVEVLTGMPNYPKGNIYEGYSIFGPFNEEYEGIKVRRIPIIPRGKDSSIMLALNYISYMVMGCIRILPMLLKKYDRVFMFQTSPITAAIPAILYSKVRKVPAYIYIQDLWPETFYTIVPVENKKIRKLFKKICTIIYRSFDKILISSRGFKEILVESEIKDGKIIYFPQWAEDLYMEKVEVEKNPKEFVLTFAGNIGKAQSVDTIIKAANLAKDKEHIKWHILGNGSDFEYIENLIKEYGLENTVKLFGRKPVTDMPKYFAASDALLVTLKDEGILRITLPAKVQSYMAAGKPIISAITGEGSHVIEDSKCGFTGDGEDYEKLYENVMKLHNMSEEERVSMGLRGQEYFKKNFTQERLLNQLNDIMQ